MLIIIKSVLRFIKNCKLSIIGLFTLIFFSAGIFTLLNQTTQNLQNSYNYITKQGNLHDFVINDNYTIGNADYIFTYKNGSKRNENNKTFATYQFTPNNLTVENATSDIYTNINWTGAYLKVFQNFFDNKNLNMNEWTNYKNNYILFEKEFELNSKDTTDDTNTAQPSVPEGNGTIKNPINTSAIYDFMFQKKISLKSFSLKEIENIFFKNLTSESDLSGLTYRKFNALDVNNTKQNVFFKVVESSPEYSIDKVVYYNGNHLENDEKLYSNITNGLVDAIGKTTPTIEEKTLIKNRTRFLAQKLSQAQWSQQKIEDDFVMLNEFLLLNENFNPYLDNFDQTITLPANLNAAKIKSAIEHLKKFVNSLKPENKNGYFINNKGFQLTFEFTKIVPIVGKIDDFSSYQIIVSPDYAKNIGKEPISFVTWQETTKEGFNQRKFNEFLKSLPNKNKIYIDSMEFILFGFGVSPDFMYPVVSQENIIPNRNSEQVVYVNKTGYEKISEAFRGNNTENFIVGKFPSNINRSEWNDKISKINQIAKKYMAWPENINSAYLFDDINNQITATAARVQFIPTTIQAANTISLFLTSFVLILSIFISIIIVKRFIQTNRNSLGIMLANGYKKIEIIFAINLFILIPISFATIFGYLIGFSLQQTVISLLGNFWTIPTTFASFSFLYLSIICLGIIILFIFITTLFSWILLSGETAEFMKDDAKYKMSKVAIYMKAPFYKFGILTRFRSSIAFSSLWRLFILSIMTTCMMASLTFSFAIANRYERTSYDSFSPKKYSYSLKLITPTVQGGQYYTVPYSAQGMTLNEGVYYNNNPFAVNEINNTNFKKLSYLATKSPYSTSSYTTNQDVKNAMLIYGNYQAVSSSDNSLMGQDLFYLKNQSTTKSLLAHNVGLLGITANPWAIGESMMPPNNATYAKNSYDNMLSTAYVDDESMVENIQLGTTTSSNHSYSEIMNYYTQETTNMNSDSAFAIKQTDGTFKYREFNNKTTKSLALEPNFLLFLMHLYSNPKYKNYLYSINYNKIIINNDINNPDIPYSYLDFKILKVNDVEKNISENLFATGFSDININDKKIVPIDLKNQKQESINSKLSETKFIPIIINEFAKKKYELEIGDELDIIALNTTDRFSRKIIGSNLGNNKIDQPIYKVKVVEVASTYQNSEFYMSQYDVNKMIGLDINGVSANKPVNANEFSNGLEKNIWNGKILVNKNEFNYKNSGFNGIFTFDSNSLVQITNGVSLYATSGLYMPVDKFELSPTVKKQLSHAGNKQKIIDITGIKINATSADQVFIQQLIDIFGESAQYSIISNTESIGAMVNVFSNITNIASSIQNIVLGLIIFISLVIIVIISSLIITDSINLAAILKCLGLNDRQNTLSFLAVYVPVILIGLLFAIPISYGINLAYTNIIFKFGGMLIVLPMVWWHYLLAISVIFIIFSFSYFVTFFKIRHINLRQAIK